jgi:ABC-2 type transport system ATP-binding protein
MKPIEIDKLSKTFRGKNGRIEALKDLSLGVDSGEVCGFLGPNGAGKSTTIKTLVGQICSSSGRAMLFGQPSGSAVARKRIGYLPENPVFYDFLSSYEYLDLVGQVFGMDVASIRRESDRVLEIMALTEAANRPIRGYSKGMVQRLGLAQTLLHDPDLYILDEPMSGLDPVGRALVKNLIRDLKLRGKTVFFSTHVIADVEALCDRVAIIAQGQLRADNAVNEIIAEGIDGYRVRLEQKTPAELLEYLDGELAIKTGDLYVPRQHFNVFMQKVDQSGSTIHLIEPRRKSLEDFFLKIIT